MSYPEGVKQGVNCLNKKGKLHFVARQLSREKEFLWNPERKTRVLLWRGSKQIIRIKVERQPYKDHDRKGDKAKAVINPI